jgi:hypothetical protein
VEALNTPHDTPPYPFMPSPTFGLSSGEEGRPHSHAALCRAPRATPARAGPSVVFDLPPVKTAADIAGAVGGLATLPIQNPGAQGCRAAQGMRQAAGIKGGMLFQETSGKASDEQDGQQGHPWDDKRSEFFFFHNGITALPYGVFQALGIVAGVLAVIALVLVSAAMIVARGRTSSRRH